MALLKYINSILVTYMDIYLQIIYKFTIIIYYSSLIECIYTKTMKQTPFETARNYKNRLNFFGKARDAIIQYSHEASTKRALPVGHFRSNIILNTLDALLKKVLLNIDILFSQS